MTEKTRGATATSEPVAGLLYYHHDALGSVSDLTDHLGENTVKYRWDAFGGMFAGALAPPTASRELPARTMIPSPDSCSTTTAGTTPR